MRFVGWGDAKVEIAGQCFHDMAVAGDENLASDTHGPTPIAARPGAETGGGGRQRLLRQQSRQKASVAGGVAMSLDKVVTADIRRNLEIDGKTVYPTEL
jgi:hypothetical protein